MKLKLGLILVLVFISLIPRPVAAATITTGSGAFEGSITLPTMPCNCPGGLFSGTMALSLSGVSDITTIEGAPLPYSATWAGVGDAAASFGYNEVCVPNQPDNTPPLEGFATGIFSVSGGVVSVGASVLPATLSGGFTWQRVGTAAHIVFYSLNIMSGTTLIATNMSNTIEGQSASGFAFGLPVGTCVTTVSPQTATAAGIALQLV